MKTITVTEAYRNFSDLVSRVHDAGETVILTRGKKPVARITPARPRKTGADLHAWIKTQPEFSTADGETFAKTIEDARKTMNVPPVDKWKRKTPI